MKTEFQSGDPTAVIALIAAIREQANAYIVSALARRGVADLLPAHGAVLNALFQQSPLLMSALAERIGRKKNTVTGLITTLEERGYCRRETDPADARAQRIVLTEKGEAMRQVQQDVSNALLAKAWGTMEASKKMVCMQSLQTILYNLVQK